LSFGWGTRAGTRPAPTGAFEGGRGRRQAQGLRLLGFDGTGGAWVGGVLSVGHVSNIGTRSGEACCRRGGVAGAEPPHKGGPNRPDRPKARREGRGERGEKNLRSAREGSRIDSGGADGWGVGEWRAVWGWVRWGKCV